MRRAAELNITEVFQGIDNKLSILNEVIEKYQLSYENVAYIGDDVNDLECMNSCYVKACPADAIGEVLDVVDYTCKMNGGNGAVREFIDLIVKTQSNTVPFVEVNTYR